MKPEIVYVYNKLKKLRFDFNSIDFEDFRGEYRYEPTLKRYVRKDDNDLFIDKNTFKPLEEELEYADKCHSLEEQLGCPLEVVFKALNNGVYCQFEWDKGKKMYYFNVITNGKYFLLTLMQKNDTRLYFKDYGKTWWLKEDRSE